MDGTGGRGLFRLNKKTTKSSLDGSWEFCETTVRRKYDGGRRLKVPRGNSPGFDR